MTAATPTRAQSWNDVPVLDSVPADSWGPDPDEITIEVDGTRYLELPESGWAVMVGWVAGTQRLRRHPDRIDRYFGEVWTVHDGQESPRRLVPRTTEDQQIINSDLDEMATEAGIPPRPHGFRWFLRLPDGLDQEQFWEQVQVSFDQITPEVTHGPEMTRAMAGVVADLYGDDARR